VETTLSNIVFPVSASRAIVDSKINIDVGEVGCVALEKTKLELVDAR